MNLDPSERVNAQFEASIAVKTKAAETLATRIADGGSLLADCLLDSGKILCCGNGGSAADAQHFSSEMLNRFERERPGLAAITLTTDASTITSIGNDYQFADIFAKQIRALGNAEDVLLAITTSGNSHNILNAIDAAHDNDLTVLLLSGKDGGDAGRSLNAQDIEIRVPSQSTARIQETHITIIHCLCDLVDTQLLGQEE